MRPTVSALAKKRADGCVEVRAPSVGLWREAPAQGTLVRPGMRIGAIETLGMVTDLIVPEGAAGIAIEVLDRGRARCPVGHGDLLLLLDPEHAGQLAKSEVESAAERKTSGLIFAAPMAGRFYLRPSPDKPPYLREGDELAPGQTICLLEVMKTFNRITYGGPGHPERARVVKVVPADGTDLSIGDPILELEAI